MSELLKISNQRTPFSISSYLIQIILGFSYITSITDAKALTSIVDPRWVKLWAIALFSFGLIAFVAIMLSPRLLQVTLLIESASCLSLALLNGVYYVSLVETFGWLGVWTTKMFVLGMVLGSSLRSIQAFGEYKKYLVAQEAIPTPTKG